MLYTRLEARVFYPCIVMLTPSRSNNRNGYNGGFPLEGVGGRAKTRRNERGLYSCFTVGWGVIALSYCGASLSGLVRFIPWFTLRET